ncbi:uncharacterized protein LOC107432519 [Ziziphus jujuba]|uniref:Uncharacterized protein LOC107432519 n=1 Tax=Ziziphus jujuba TaxID=326968 RepID=A0A6P4ARE9_ZIZJJ|nr:uncharacterized protein LOC107432519 [Ziziphus jujuba]
MEPIEDPSGSSSYKEEIAVEAVDLLEECWFFHNLLDRKPRMVRCFSDPCPSNIVQQVLEKDNIERKENSLSASEFQERNTNGSFRSNLLRTPSLPPNIGREGVKEKHKDSRRSKLTRQTSHKFILQTTKEPPCVDKKEGKKERGSDSSRSKTNRQPLLHRNLQRIPSLPPYIGSLEMSQEEEIDPFTSKSSRQAFHKGLPRYRPPRNTEKVESVMNSDGCKEMRRRFLNEGKSTMRKSLSDLEFEEVQGFKDLGFTFDNKDLSTCVVNIIPGLQEKKKEDLNQEKVRRPYLSEAWMVQSCASRFPNWDATKSSEDMKAQIKFWARAVASNVR